MFGLNVKAMMRREWLNILIKRFLTESEWRLWSCQGRRRRSSFSMDGLKLNMCSVTNPFLLSLLTIYQCHLPFLFPSRNQFGAKNIKQLTCATFWFDVLFIVILQKPIHHKTSTMTSLTISPLPLVHLLSSLILLATHSLQYNILLNLIHI